MEPFYIQTIHITGLMGSREINWDLRQDVNILGGPNGSGKSLIMRSCYELLSKGRIDDRKCSKLIKSITLDFTNGWSLYWQSYSDTNNEATFMDKDGKMRNNHGELVGDDQHLPKGDLIIPIKTPTFQVLRLTNEHRECQKNLDALIQGTLVLYVNSFEQRIADAIRLSQRPSENRDEENTLLDALIKEEKNKRNEMYADAFFSLYHNNQVDDSFKSKIFMLRDACAQFFSDYDLSYLDPGLEFAKKGNGRGVKNSFPFTQLSMGEKQLLLILLTSTNTQNQPAIFIMDEPDLGMHVDWKKKLLTILHQLNPNMQLIVSTHAPSMVTGWRDCVNEIGEITLNGED